MKNIFSVTAEVVEMMMMTMMGGAFNKIHFKCSAREKESKKCSDNVDGDDDDDKKKREIKINNLKRLVGVINFSYPHQMQSLSLFGSLFTMSHIDFFIVCFTESLVDNLSNHDFY